MNTHSHPRPVPEHLPAFAQVRFVLSHTTHTGNIGAAARAIKNMGFGRLVLVNPKHGVDAQAISLASGAADVLEAAHICSSLSDALAGCQAAVAVTARWREFSLPFADARQSTLHMAQVLVDTPTAEVAFVFGTEMSGLSNEEVLQCSQCCHIPANPVYSSLNLAQAVQLISYEMRMALGAGLAASPYPPNPVAPVDDMERFYQHLEQTLVDIGFLNPKQPKKLMPRLRRLFARAGVEKLELDILRGVLAAVQKSRAL